MKEISKEDIEHLREGLDQFREKYGLEIADILKLFDNRGYLPISIFNDRLSPLETIVKYLKNNQGLKLKEIASLLNKDTSSCWLAYRNSMKKHAGKLRSFPSRYDIPIKELKSKKLSLLEKISCYLRDEFKLNFREIGKMLNRNERTIWTVVNRARKKLEDEE